MRIYGFLAIVLMVTQTVHAGEGDLIIYSFPDGADEAMSLVEGASSDDAILSIDGETIDLKRVNDDGSLTPPRYVGSFNGEDITIQYHYTSVGTWRYEVSYKTIGHFYDQYAGPLAEFMGVQKCRCAGQVEALNGCHAVLCDRGSACPNDATKTCKWKKEAAYVVLIEN